jgi:hypothetical protein
MNIGNENGFFNGSVATELMTSSIIMELSLVVNTKMSVKTDFKQ